MLVISACTAENATHQSTSTYVSMPTRISIPIPTATLPPMEMVSPTTPFAVQTAPPAWVTDFANPILVKASGQYPNFQDDFTDQLNHGWYYAIADNYTKPYYAHLEDDALILKIPDGLERKDSMVYSTKLAHKNFVLSFDFKFGKTEPTDIFRFQYKQTQNQSVILDLSKNETSTIHWNLYNNSQSITGDYEYFGPALVSVVLIMQDNECAVYINHDPFGYLSDCRANPILQPLASDLSFHLLSTTGHPATVTLDNVKVWDLDKPLNRP